MPVLIPLSLGTVGVLGAGWAWEKAHRRTHPVAEGYRPEIDLPHTQEFELYHNALSLCSMKTRVCLAELSVPYKSHHIDLIETGAYENIRRKLLAVNPAGTVPVLVHDGHPIYESHEQIRYAALHAPASSPRLVPEDPDLGSAMNYWVDRSSITEDPLDHGDQSAGNVVPGLTVPLFAAMIETIPYHRIFEGFLFHFDKKRPALFTLLKARGLARLHKILPAIKLLARSRRQMATHLDELERQLTGSDGPWILGEIFTLADVSWLVIFERLVQADCLHVFFGEKRPACTTYWSRLQERASYQSAIREHSHPTIARGTERLKAAKQAVSDLRVALEGC